MARIHRRATLDAPPEIVFGIIEDPWNWPRFVPHVEGVSEIRRSDRRVGDTFRLIYRVVGITFEETLVVAEYEWPSVYKMEVAGRMKGIQNWNLQRAGGQTNVTVEVDYRLPGGPAGRALDAVVLRPINERTIERMLENLPGLLEQAPSEERSQRGEG